MSTTVDDKAAPDALAEELRDLEAQEAALERCCSRSSPWPSASGRSSWR
jgi:hypothetical protein